VPTAVVLTACVDVWSTVVSRWQRRWHVGAVARGVVLTVLPRQHWADDALLSPMVPMVPLVPSGLQSCVSTGGVSTGGHHLRGRGWWWL